MAAAIKENPAGADVMYPHGLKQRIPPSNHPFRSSGDEKRKLKQLGMTKMQNQKQGIARPVENQPRMFLLCFGHSVIRISDFDIRIL
jgi:hypothetical protein